MLPDGGKMIYMGVYFLFADMKELQIQNPLIYRIKKKKEKKCYFPVKVSVHLYSFNHPSINSLSHSLHILSASGKPTLPIYFSGIYNEVSLKKKKEIIWDSAGVGKVKFPFSSSPQLLFYVPDFE